ncbi:exopolysaccharide transport family protein [Pedobacter glucosidilyticus]|uniref:exopolysaccharide transport family protein n=1 Tax=Pedobacter glucosidilyticus TaxID=1122941 RepID=UPI00047958B5|nr:hypothetical protein [Pedobacter glucosidilyticus]
MNFNKFFKVLNRKKFILIIIPIVTVIITYFLSKNMLDAYQSEAQIATGLVDETQRLLQSDNSNTHESQVNQKFNNLMEIMRLKKTIDLVSYKLMIHDLKSKKPFRKYSDIVSDLSEAEKVAAIKAFEKKYADNEPLLLWDKKQKKLEEMLVSMQYHEEALKKKLTIFRNNNSDFITITFDSENPDLSAFVVNTLATEFIDYYTRISKESEIRGTTYLGNLLQQKRDSLNKKMNTLKNFKIANNVLNLHEQSKILYGEIMDFESKKLEAQKNIESFSQTLYGIDAKFNPKDRRYLDATLTKINQEIVSTKQKLKGATDRHIRSGFTNDTRVVVDSLQELLSDQINYATDKYIVNPLASKEKLVLEKLNLEVSSDLAKYSINSINNHLEGLNAKFKNLVPFEAIVQSYERDIDVASSEYLDVLNKYNDANMQSNYKAKLRLIQQAMPGLPQPSKKMLLVILSGIISFIFCVAILLVIFLFDKSISTAKELALVTKQPILGELPKINNLSDLKDIWTEKDLDDDKLLFKKQMRSIRFEIKKDLLYKKDKVLGITSIDHKEGKTFFSLSLAYSFAMLGKKVLLIDGNFDHPSISESVVTKVYLEDFSASNQIYSDTIITILANKGGDLSLLEVIKEEEITQFFDDLKSKFDIILIDTCALKDLNKAKEWLVYTDKNIGVFKFGNSLPEEKIEHCDYLVSNPNYLGWIFNKVEKNPKIAI